MKIEKIVDYWEREYLFQNVLTFDEYSKINAGEFDGDKQEVKITVEIVEKDKQ